MSTRQDALLAHLRADRPALALAGQPCSNPIVIDGMA